MRSLLVLALLFLTLPLQTPAAHASEIRGASVFNAINSERQSHGLRPLTPSTQLVMAAQAKADHMARLHYFAHTYGRINLRSFLANVRYPYRTAGENLAEGYTSTESLISAWMNSRTHRANILDPDFKETGIGITHDNGTLIIVQYFGTRK